MSVLCFIDTETTGLDPDRHQAYEVCWWREDEALPNTAILPHTLNGADQVALEISRYHRRLVRPGRWQQDRWQAVSELPSALCDVTLVGSNPAFDAAFLRKILEGTPWHHRLINVAEGGMWVFGWDRPQGLATVADKCRQEGFDVPEPDHTAEGDVRATRAVYEALRAIRGAK